MEQKQLSKEDFENVITLNVYPYEEGMARTEAFIAGQGIAAQFCLDLHNQSLRDTCIGFSDWLHRNDWRVEHFPYWDAPENRFTMLCHQHNHNNNISLTIEELFDLYLQHLQQTNEFLTNPSQEVKK